MNPPAKFPVMLQQASSDCGVACLSAIIRFFEGNVSLERLRELSGTAVQGTTLLGLAEGAQRCGLEAEAFRVDGILRLAEIDRPAILHVVMEEKFSHFVVCYGVDSQGFHLMDPARGRVILSSPELDEIWKSKSLLLVKPTLLFQTANEQKEGKKQWIWRLVEQDLPILVISAFLGLVLTILGLSVAVFSQKLIDEILPDRDVEKLILGLGLVTLLLIARSVIAFLKSTVLIRQSKELNERLLGSFFNHLMSLPKRFFDFRKIGDITSRMNDSRRIQRAISVLSAELLVDAFVVIVTLVSVFLYSLEIGWVVIVFLPVYFAMVYHFHRPISDHQKKMMIRYGASEGQFIDTLSGIGAIKAMGKEAHYAGSNLNQYSMFQEEVFALGKVSNRLGLVSQLAGVFFLSTILGFSSFLVFEDRMDLGVMIAITSFIGMLVPSVNKLALSNLQIQEAKIAFDRLYEFIGVEPEKGKSETVFPEKVNSITLENLNFRFPGRKSLLKEISFRMECGKLTVLLGESGGGKSTLLQILLRFYPLESGRILLNEELDSEGIALNDWRKAIGYVPQEVKLFNGTVLDNICINEPKKSAEAVFQMCRVYGLEQFFVNLPQGYLTLIGEEGLNLSGGQRQLLGLARALFPNPKILLLDEFTGAMDRNTEKKILDLILKMKEQMPVLIVTHRIKPALQADQVLILEEGRILTQGKPGDLLKSENLLSASYDDLLG